MKNYCSLPCVPYYTHLHSPHTPTPFDWTSEAEAPFKELKHYFASASILVQPDECIVAVDAYDTGVGAVLSQSAAVDNKLHPCTFFFSQTLPCRR